MCPWLSFTDLRRTAVLPRPQSSCWHGHLWTVALQVTDLLSFPIPHPHLQSRNSQERVDFKYNKVNSHMLKKKKKRSSASKNLRLKIQLLKDLKLNQRWKWVSTWKHGAGPTCCVCSHQGWSTWSVSWTVKKSTFFIKNPSKKNTFFGKKLVVSK